MCVCVCDEKCIENFVPHGNDSLMISGRIATEVFMIPDALYQMQLASGALCTRQIPLFSVSMLS